MSCSLKTVTLALSVHIRYERMIEGMVGAHQEGIQFLKSQADRKGITREGLCFAEAFPCYFVKFCNPSMSGVQILIYIALNPLFQAIFCLRKAVIPVNFHQSTMRILSQFDHFAKPQIQEFVWIITFQCFYVFFCLYEHTVII